jgi:hypothetical protein
MLGVDVFRRFARMESAVNTVLWDGAISRLMPRAAAIGAALRGATMVGAIRTYLVIIGGNPALPVALLPITSIVALQRRPTLSRVEA